MAILIKDDGGVIVIGDDILEVKLDKDRKVYVKKPDQSQFSSVNVVMDPGWSHFEKKTFLFSLHQKMCQKMQQSTEERKADSVRIEVDDEEDI